MSRREPFIPRDKPRFFVVAVVAGLLGLLSGLLAFGAAWLDLRALASLFKAAFVLCWLVMFPSMIAFSVKQWSGRYAEVTERPWKDQVW